MSTLYQKVLNVLGYYQDTSTAMDISDPDDTSGPMELDVQIVNMINLPPDLKGRRGGCRAPAFDVNIRINSDHCETLYPKIVANLEEIKKGVRRDRQNQYSLDGGVRPSTKSLTPCATAEFLFTLPDGSEFVPLGQKGNRFVLIVVVRVVRLLKLDPFQLDALVVLTAIKKKYKGPDFKQRVESICEKPELLTLGMAQFELLEDLHMQYRNQQQQICALQSDMKEVKGDVKVVKGDVKELKMGLGSTNCGVAQLEAQMKHVLVPMWED